MEAAIEKKVNEIIITITTGLKGLQGPPKIRQREEDRIHKIQETQPPRGSRESHAGDNMVESNNEEVSNRY